MNNKNIMINISLVQLCLYFNNIRIHLSVSIKKNINFSKSTYMLLVSASTRNLKSLILFDLYSTSFKVIYPEP